jgi:hypothetical protein
MVDLLRAAQVRIELGLCARDDYSEIKAEASKS